VNASGSAQRRITCTNASGVTLPDGRQVALTPQSAWPGFTADMPFAERIEEFTTPSGPPVVLVDNTQKIDATLKAWNDSQRWPPPPDTTVGGTAGAGGAPPSGGGAGNTGGSTVTGIDMTGGAGGAPRTGAGGLMGNDVYAGDGSSGCGCRAPGAPPRQALPIAFGAAIATLAARRRRSARPGRKDL
jgi:hypothetical protein